WPLRVVQLPDRDCVRDPASPTGGAAAGHCRPSLGRSLTWPRTAPQRVRPIAWPKNHRLVDWPGWFWMIAFKASCEVRAGGAATAHAVGRAGCPVAFLDGE